MADVGEEPSKCDYNNSVSPSDNLLQLDMTCESEVMQAPVKKVRGRYKKTREKTIFKCELCGKRYLQNCHLKTHIFTHTGEKPFKCNLCTNAYNQISHLKRHLMVHAGDKPFNCDICGKAFSSPSSVKQHVMSHTGERPFQCQFCERAFSRSNRLKNHVLQQHNNEEITETVIQPVTTQQQTENTS